MSPDTKKALRSAGELCHTKWLYVILHMRIQHHRSGSCLYYDSYYNEDY